MAHSTRDESLKLVKNIELCCQEVIINLTMLLQTTDLNKKVVSLDDDRANSFWANLRNNTLSVAIIRWNNVFGVFSEPTHWHRLPGIDKKNVRQKILDYCNIDSKEWGAAHGSANALRNQVLAHNEFNNPAPNPFRHMSTYLQSARYIRSVAISWFSGKHTSDTALADYIYRLSRLSNEKLEGQVTNMVTQGLKYSNKANHSDR